MEVTDERVGSEDGELIGKVTRGTAAGRLLAYLYGPGRANEHTEPHLVAGFGDPAELEPDRRPDGSPDLRRLSGLLTLPLAVTVRANYDQPVWHCSVRAAPGDRTLSDDEWAQVAAEIMNRTGLAPDDDDLGVRWVAVRHAPDHIHIVATLARQDGGRPRIWNDFYRVREACRAAEQRFGLQTTAPADRTAARRPSRAESELAARQGWREAPRVTLRREVCAAAAAASTEQEFFAWLRESGVLVRQRASTRNPGEITGYAVALEQHTNRDGAVVWFGGGKLAADLTLPKLRQRWKPQIDQKQCSADRRITFAERNAAYEYAAREARAAAREIRLYGASDPAWAGDAAWAAADALHAAARALSSPQLRRAADAYDRAARAPYGRIPACTPPGERLRALARMLSVMGVPGGHRSANGLLLGLASLAAEVADLRTAQRHAAQAAAARRAAEHLRGPAPGWAAAAPGRAHRARASDTARKDFPGGLTAFRQAAASHRPAPASDPARRTGTSRPHPRRARPPPS